MPAESYLMDDEEDRRAINEEECDEAGDLLRGDTPGLRPWHRGSELWEERSELCVGESRGSGAMGGSVSGWRGTSSKMLSAACAAGSRGTSAKRGGAPSLMKPQEDSK